jgi:hypothetical protein
MSEDKIKYLPIWYVKQGGVSVFTVLYGLFRVLNIGSVGVVTILGVTILAWQPFPEWMK